MALEIFYNGPECRALKRGDKVSFYVQTGFDWVLLGAARWDDTIGFYALSLGSKMPYDMLTSFAWIMRQRWVNQMPDILERTMAA